MSRLTTTIKIASVVIGLGAVSFGALVYRQAHPPLPPGLATLAGTHLSTAQGSPIPSGRPLRRLLRQSFRSGRHGASHAAMRPRLLRRSGSAIRRATSLLST